MKSFVYFVTALCVFAFASCGGGGSSGVSGMDETTTTTTTTTTTLSSDTGSNAGTSRMEVVELGTGTSFTLPSDVISFVVSAFGEVSSFVGFAALTNPNGEDLFITGNYPLAAYDLALVAESYGNVLVPMVTDHAAIAGEWNFQYYQGTNDVKLTMRTGSTPTSSVLKIKPYLTGTQYSVSDVEGALAILKNIYEKAGLQVELDTVSVLSDSKFQAVSSDFNNIITSEMVSMGSADRINLFFIEDFSGEDAGTLGIAAGIPGSLGIASNRNGVLNSLEAHVLGGALDTQLLGETVAHEMGHFIGLFHPTEKNGVTFDPLADTAECSISMASSALAGPQPSDCIGFGGENLMFWQGDPSIDQTSLTSDQVHIINYSPVAK